MDVSVVEKLIRIATRRKVKIRKISTLTAGGKFPYADGVEEEALTWEQMVPEKQRMGFHLWQRARVVKGDDKGFIGYVAGWYPYPDYTLVLLTCEKRRMSPKFAYKSTDLEGLVD